MLENNKKRSLNFSFKLICLIFLGLSFIGIGLNAFAQNDTDQGQVQQIQQIQEEHDTKDLNKLLNDYNKDQQKVMNDAETIQKMDSSTHDELGEGELEIAPVKKRVSKKQWPVENLNKVKYSDALRIALEPLQKMSEAELLMLLKNNTNGSASAEYIKKFPKLALFSVKVIKDKDALPSFAKVLDDQNKLIHFVAIMLFTILFGFFLKHLFKKEGRGIPMAILVWFVRFFILSSVRLAIIYYFYSHEITPALNLAYKTLF